MSQISDVSNHGSEHYTDWIATKNRARDLLALMLNVRREQIAFMRNTSDGFASVATGIDWAEGDNIVSFEGEFPANDLSVSASASKARSVALSKRRLAAERV